MPTTRQKKVFKKVVENGRAVSAAMRESGYSKKTAVDPGKVTRSKGWNELMEQYIPDKLLAKKHLELLNHSSYKAIATGVDMGYKLKGKYKDPTGGARVLIINIPPDKKAMVKQALADYLHNEKEND